MRAAERSRLLLRFAELIRQSEEQLIELESIDSGKPVSVVRRHRNPCRPEPRAGIARAGIDGPGYVIFIRI